MVSIFVLVFGRRESGKLLRFVCRPADTLMPLRESEAIVLRTYPLGEGDRLVSFLSRSFGRMRGVAAGARRIKSRFGSSLEPLSYIRIWFFERETRDLVRVNQCELLESFLETQSDYVCGLALAQVSEISEAVLPEREASDAAFRLVLLTARAVKATRKTELPMAYFLLWTVKLAGWLPELDRCARCGGPLQGAKAYASVIRHGLACEKCRLPAMRSIAAESLAAATKMLSQSLEKLINAASVLTPPADLSTHLLELIEHQIERKLNTRKLMESQV
jgi:DNA repair protein RecO (recombination protein O)